MVKEYVSKPVKIQAIKLEKSANNITDVINFILNSNKELEKDYRHTLLEIISSSNCLIFKDGENTLKASLGDYIVKGIDSRFYIYSPQLFRKSFFFSKREE